MSYTHTVTYLCLLCPEGQQPSYEDRKEFTQHCLSEHQLSIDDLKAARGVSTGFLDGRGWSARTSHWRLADGRDLAEKMITTEKVRPAKQPKQPGTKKG